MELNRGILTSQTWERTWQPHGIGLLGGSLWTQPVTWISEPLGAVGLWTTNLDNWFLILALLLSLSPEETHISFGLGFPTSGGEDRFCHFLLDCCIMRWNPPSWYYIDLTTGMKKSARVPSCLSSSCWKATLCCSQILSVLKHTVLQPRLYEVIFLRVLFL